MDDRTIQDVVVELRKLLLGRLPGKMFQLDDESLAIDFGLKAEGFLFVSIEPSAPRMYLIKRRIRDLQKQSRQPSAFVHALGTKLAGARLLAITKDEGERIVRLRFQPADLEACDLIAQLTGRSANLFLVDSSGLVAGAMRKTKGDGQEVGQVYAPPVQERFAEKTAAISARPDESISQALDTLHQQRERQRAFETAANRLRSKLRSEVSKRKRLKANLEKDLADHGNPEQHRRIGDLLLANIATAMRRGDVVSLIDYYAEDSPTIEVPVDSNTSLQDAASESFSRYAKAKRAVKEIGNRLVQIDHEIEELTDKLARVEDAMKAGDELALAPFIDLEIKPKQTPKRAKKQEATLPGLRRYRSSDGYEVIVGRSARDNDTVTFRVARPNDLWLHAGDYPGSHVIVRNSSRKDIPHRTIVEAAQLAAKFSQASNDSKVAVHYTQRKFVTKPKNAASGLVRLSSFRTITVEPKEGMERV